MIYADNAATTQLDIEVFEKMKMFLLAEYANISQPYSFARAGKKALKQAREIIARCINAMPEEIFFTSCGTESDNWAIKGTMLFSERKGIITSEIEHHAVLNPCHTMEKLGYSLQYLKVNKEGKVPVEALKNVITAKDRLVSIMMANNEIGTIQDIKALCEIAHERNLVFHTDAVQALGHIHIDVKDLGVDMLSASAHKFNGPKGIGFIYIRKGLEISPLIEGGSQENGYRAGTENVASILGMALALEKNCKDIDKNRLHLEKLEKIFFEVLDKNGVDYIHNGGMHRIPGNISISIKNEDGERILHRLDLMKICISTGSACNGKYNVVSHVIHAIGVPEEYAKGTIRVSFGHNNSEAEAREVANAIVKIIA